MLVLCIVNQNLNRFGYVDQVEETERIRRFSNTDAGYDGIIIILLLYFVRSYCVIKGEERSSERRGQSTLPRHSKII